MNGKTTISAGIALALFGAGVTLAALLPVRALALAGALLLLPAGLCRAARR